jgi:hypothetical protein
MDSLLVLLGLYVLCSKATIALDAMRVLFLVKGGRLIEKYPGRQGAPWALVTGCTAGIGE